MKMLLRKNVSGLGKIGDVVEVRPGYARNYLLPQGLAFQPLASNIRQVELEKKRYLEELARQRAEIEARAALVDGKEVTIAARANVEGHLYGSVGPAQIASALAEIGHFIEPEDVALDEPIRRLDRYDVPLRFSEDVTATIQLWVVPIHGEGESAEEAPQAGPGDEDAAPDGA
ncbi:MAG TPA: 50S ribosomal protein L9 [Phycisphaerae bacterium]|nr:50S ribosomal protein L9 [Phycisphaerae bacterium]